MIDYGTLKVYEEHDVIAVLEKALVEPEDAMRYVMTYFRGFINPAVVKQAIDKFYS